MSQQQAFDPLAPTYDDHFTNTQIGQYLRGLVHERLSTHFKTGDHVLELGCGTGEDALWLAGRGIRVTATDVSEGMLAAARAKCAGNGLVRVERVDLNRLPVTSYQLPAQGDQLSAVSGQENPRQVNETPLFDGVFSNFGPMNCLSEWRTVAVWLAQRVKKGGIVGLGVMSPLCMWEPLWHGLHADFKVATRRWRKGITFQPQGIEDAIHVVYPTIQHLTREFEPYFKRVFVRGLGVFLPPSDVYGAIEKRPKLLKLLMGFEQRWGANSKLALLADHYWVEFERL